jgi:hypothetical protein
MNAVDNKLGIKQANCAGVTTEKIRILQKEDGDAVNTKAQHVVLFEPRGAVGPVSFELKVSEVCAVLRSRFHQQTPMLCHEGHLLDLHQGAPFFCSQRFRALKQLIVHKHSSADVDTRDLAASSQTPQSLHWPRSQCHCCRLRRWCARLDLFGHLVLA